MDPLTSKVSELSGAVERLAATKRAAILGGVPTQSEFVEQSFLQDLADWRLHGSYEAAASVKSILGTSVATGLAVVPGSFVSDVARQVATLSPWRNILNFETVAVGTAVDVPYEVTAITAALVQGAFGSNKDNRDFTFGRATATLYTIAQIADVSTQLLRQSGGAAERVVRRRLASSFAMTESAFIVNGTGSGQPLGILPAFLAFGDPAAFKTTLSAEPRAATIGRALGALEGRGRTATAVVMSPTDYWETATEGLGTSYAGGWALAPAEGPSSQGSPATMWGVPVYRCADLPVGTALVGDFSDAAVWIGSEMRIDVSAEAGTRWDQNLVGYRCEEEMGWTAEPYVRVGAIQKVLGL
jgi:HK97 family phage major capsid protein